MVLSAGGQPALSHRDGAWPGPLGADGRHGGSMVDPSRSPLDTPGKIHHWFVEASSLPVWSIFRFHVGFFPGVWGVDVGKPSLSRPAPGGVDCIWCRRSGPNPGR